MSGICVLQPDYNVVVVGGGPAGLAAALSAKKNGAEKVLILERNHDLGGILNQCIHNGFGLHYFGQELTGPEYAEKFIAQLAENGIDVAADSMVLEVTPDRVVYAISPTRGYLQLRPDALILAMGCRERTRGAIGIPGTRPSGVLTAGAAQLYMNIEGYQIGRKVVILGSGDIGLIMARRLTLEGAEVVGVYELMPYSAGLTRNIVQCLEDYNIPLHLSHTITDIQGQPRVEKVTVQQVDENRVPIPGTTQVLDCDTVLLSVGLIPENELSRQAGVVMDKHSGGPRVFENMETSLPGIFACGNVAHVHDLVDFVTAEAEKAGAAAAQRCKSGSPASAGMVQLSPGEGVSYTVPQQIRPGGVDQNVDIYFRVNKVCGLSRIVLRAGDKTIARYKREHMAPGEMEKISLPKALLCQIAEGEATLLVEDADSGPEGGKA